jgi:tetratricopeptide (TPR) repeat protein
LIIVCHPSGSLITTPVAPGQCRPYGRGAEQNRDMTTSQSSHTRCYTTAVRTPVLVLVLFAMFVLSLASCASYRGARLYRSGSASLERGDAEAAVAQLEEAASLIPQASEIQNHLGLAYLETGRTREAVAAFDRAVVLDCDNHAASENLAAAEAKLATTWPTSDASGVTNTGEVGDGR